MVLCPQDQDRKVSANSVTIRVTTLCKKLSGYRELLLTLKAPITDAADDKFCDIFPNFRFFFFFFFFFFEKAAKFEIVVCCKL